jgi:hypothetical protein
MDGGHDLLFQGREEMFESKMVMNMFGSATTLSNPSKP